MKYEEETKKKKAKKERWLSFRTIREDIANSIQDNWRMRQKSEVKWLLTRDQSFETTCDNNKNYKLKYEHISS